MQHCYRPLFSRLLHPTHRPPLLKSSQWNFHTKPDKELTFASTPCRINYRCRCSVLCPVRLVTASPQPQRDLRGINLFTYHLPISNEPRRKLKTGFMLPSWYSVDQPRPSTFQGGHTNYYYYCCCVYIPGAITSHWHLAIKQYCIVLYCIDACK